MQATRHLQILRDLAEIRLHASLSLEQINRAEHDLEAAWSAERTRLANRSAITRAAIATFCNR